MSIRLRQSAKIGLLGLETTHCGGGFVLKRGWLKSSFPRWEPKEGIHLLWDIPRGCPGPLGVSEKFV